MNTFAMWFGYAVMVVGGVGVFFAAVAAAYELAGKAYMLARGWTHFLAAMDKNIVEQPTGARE